MTEANVRQAAGLFKLASDETRLKIVAMLAGGRKNVTEICGVLGQSQPAVSHHLALLRVSNTIESERVGKNNYYTLTAKGERLARFAAEATE